MNHLTFRPATTSENHLLSVLYKTVYVDTYGTEGVTSEFTNFIDKQFSPNKIKEDIESSNCDLWIALFKNNPVGVIQVEYNKRCPNDNSVRVEVNKLYILRRFFRQGIGQNLIKLAESEIAKRGIKKLWLWVYEHNHGAIDFYYKLGYENIGTAYFQIEDNSYKNIVMTKSL